MARVPAFQAGCREFESRLPLHLKTFWKLKYNYLLTSYILYYLFNINIAITIKSNIKELFNYCLYIAVAHVAQW